MVRSNKKHKELISFLIAKQAGDENCFSLDDKFLFFPLGSDHMVRKDLVFLCFYYSLRIFLLHNPQGLINFQGSSEYWGL
jgi:hypothetical protein